MTEQIDIEETPRKQLAPPDQWAEMTVNQLYEQQSILMGRWMFLVENNYPYADEMKKAIDKIAVLINSK